MEVVRYIHRLIRSNTSKIYTRICKLVFPGILALFAGIADIVFQFESITVGRTEQFNYSIIAAIGLGNDGYFYFRGFSRPNILLGIMELYICRRFHPNNLRRSVPKILKRVGETVLRWHIFTELLVHFLIIKNK